MTPVEILPGALMDTFGARERMVERRLRYEMLGPSCRRCNERLRNLSLLWKGRGQSPRRGEAQLTSLVYRQGHTSLLLPDHPS